MEKVTNLFKRLNNVDAVLVTSQNNRQYFTGFQGSFGFFVLTKDSATYITDSRYYQMAVEAMESQGIKVEQIDTNLNAYQRTENIFKFVNAKTIGFENTEITVAEFEALKSKLPDYEFVAVGEEILKVRQIKTEQELEYITKAQSITDKAFTEILKFIKKDMTELEIATELEYQLKKNGATGLAFDTIIASGTNSSKPHAHPTDKKIAIGDAITMDFGARYNGYCSDMTRTVFLGEPSEQMRNIYNVVAKAQMAVLNNVKKGMTGREVDSLAREVITANGYKDNFQHGLGHSVGLDIHERPSMNPTSEEILVENQLITVEPGIYVPGLGGVRIEDLIIIKNDGIINLTKSNKNLIIL
ncbi:MAG TPA: aminopeptidase P family protein [Clostridia bacterium]|nr:aminopeptidase P family protein [Clostridia bacterium]